MDRPWAISESKAGYDSSDSDESPDEISPLPFMAPASTSTTTMSAPPPPPAPPTTSTTPSKRARARSTSSSVVFVASRPARKVPKAVPTSVLTVPNAIPSMIAMASHEDLEKHIAPLKDEDIAFKTRGQNLRAEWVRRLLGPKSWISQSAIYAYLNLVARQKNEGTHRTLHAMACNSTATPARFIILYQHDILCSKDTHSFFKKNWGITNVHEEIYHVDAILVPIQLRSHWSLGVIRPKTKTLEVINSYKEPTPDQFEILSNILKAFLSDDYDLDDWKQFESQSARQYNGWDCGAFVMRNAELIMNGRDLSECRADDMAFLRKRFALALFNNRDNT